MSSDGVNTDLRDQLETWFAADRSRLDAVWHNDEKHPIEWVANHQRYAATTLAKFILREATGVERAIRGGDWLLTTTGEAS